MTKFQENECSWNDGSAQEVSAGQDWKHWVHVQCLTIEEIKQPSEKTELDLEGKREPCITCEQKRDNIKLCFRKINLAREWVTQNVFHKLDFLKMMPGMGVQRKDKKKMLRVRHFRDKMDRSKSYLNGSRNEGEWGIRITYLYIE